MDGVLKRLPNITDVTDEVADEDATDKTKTATPPPPPSVQGVFRTNSYNADFSIESKSKMSNGANFWNTSSN